MLHSTVYIYTAKYVVEYILLYLGAGAVPVLQYLLLSTSRIEYYDSL